MNTCALNMIKCEEKKYLDRHEKNHELILTSPTPPVLHSLLAQIGFQLLPPRVYFQLLPPRVYFPQILNFSNKRNSQHEGATAALYPCLRRRQTQILIMLPCSKSISSLISVCILLFVHDMYNCVRKISRRQCYSSLYLPSMGPSVIYRLVCIKR